MDKRTLQMMSAEGFNRIFDEELKRQTNETYEAIFTRLNCEYFEAFGVYRYANHESFQRVRRRNIKK